MSVLGSLIICEGLGFRVFIYIDSLRTSLAQGHLGHGHGTPEPEIVNPEP